VHFLLAFNSRSVFLNYTELVKNLFQGWHSDRDRTLNPLPANPIAWAPTYSDDVFYFLVLVKSSCFPFNGTRGEGASLRIPQQVTEIPSRLVIQLMKEMDGTSFDFMDSHSVSPFQSRPLPKLRIPMKRVLILNQALSMNFRRMNEEKPKSEATEYSCKRNQWRSINQERNEIKSPTIHWRK